MLFVLILCIALNLSHLVFFNIFSASLPCGIYLRVNKQPQRDDCAAACLTYEAAQYGLQRSYLAQGDCPTGSVLVLKWIKGMPGDRYAVKNNFLGINGHLYHIMKKDSAGRPLKVFYHDREGILRTGQYLLLSDYVPNSWDSRYWGPVSIAFLLKPIWIF